MVDYEAGKNERKNKPGHAQYIPPVYPSEFDRIAPEYQSSDRWPTNKEPYPNQRRGVIQYLGEVYDEIEK
jgi:hypothetical protein